MSTVPNLRSLRSARRPSLAIAMAALSAGACADGIQGPRDGGHDGPPTEVLSMLVVSNPVTSRASADRSGPSFSEFATGDGTAYVSLPPGSVPDAERVVIRTRGTGTEATAVMVEGGFDPVRVDASGGDTLDVRVELAAGPPLTYVAVVPDERPPVVVRAEPPPRKRDVPLNAVMLVVFSEPIGTGLAPSSVQLLLNGTPVPGTIRFGDAQHLTVTFTPDAFLAPGAEYTFVVTEAIQDLEGDALPEEFRTDFTTASASAASTFRQVSAGLSYTCGVTGDDNGRCWGNNWNGQLGTGWSSMETWVPSVVAGGVGFVQVNASKEYTCGVATDGVAHCWGSAAGLLTDPNAASTPAPIAGGVGFTQVSAGARHACGITPDNVAYCWGHNGAGQLGDGTTDDTLDPTPVAGGLRFAQVSAGGAYTCGVTTADVAYCWGSNHTGQLGDGTTDFRLTPTRVAADLSFARVSAGVTTCGVTTRNVAYCWGHNRYGQVGDGTTDDRLTPTPVVGALSFAEVSTLFFHTCGVTTDATAYCWGLNEHGQVGDGTTDDRFTPTHVAGGLSFAQVTVGGGHSCGITTDGFTYCWGWNSAGQLGSRFGYGTDGTRLTPTPVVPF